MKVCPSKTTTSSTGESDQVNPEWSRQIDAPGVVLHVLDRCPDGDPPVLFLHGWLDNAHSFDPVREQLPHSWRSLALDFRGMGQSGHVPGGLYHLTDYLADVDAVRRALSIETLHLVGHSLGGTVALLYAAARPEAVRSVTSVESLGPSGGDGTLAVGRLQRFLRDLDKPLRKRVYPDVDAAAKRLRESQTGMGERAALLLARHGTRPVERGVEWTWDPAHRRTFGSTLDEEQLLACFRAVTCPVQVLHATHGFSFDDQQMSRRLEALRAPPPLSFEGGHHVHLDQPQQVAEAIAAFIQKNEKRRQATF